MRLIIILKTHELSTKNNPNFIVRLLQIQVILENPYFTFVKTY